MYKSTQEIKETIEKYFNTDLSNKDTNRDNVYPKSIYCYLLRKKALKSISETKIITGYKSNRSIVYHTSTIEFNQKISKQIRIDLEELEKLLA